jgi:O-succinylbenzoate synthase
MRVVRATLDELELPLVEPFETSFGVEKRRRFLLLELESDDGETGWGECVAARDPLYSSETVATARWALERYLLPALWRVGSAEPGRFVEAVRFVRGHPMAKAAVEMALWDLEARRRRLSLARCLGGRRSRVEVGVSVGIHPSVDALVRRVGEYLADGYRRIKLKVKPGWDDAPVGAVRREHPDARLWVDANQAYGADALGAIARWAIRHRVEQVEQPFSSGAWVDHARLVRRLGRGRCFVCLDESIANPEAYRTALELRALTSVNVKPGRVGGHAASGAILQGARGAAMPAWIGGMLETGIGRAHNVAIASLDAVRFPSDLSASDRYYAEDLIERPFVLGPKSTLAVPRGPGIGVTINERLRSRARRRGKSYTAGKADIQRSA